MKIDRDLLMARASRSLSAMPRPFVKWAGSKRPLLGTIASLLPDRIRVYYEPFAGSASLFFLLRPKNARLGDACHDLVSTYQAVGEDPEEVLRYLAKWKPDRDFYYKVRDMPESNDSAYLAARFIYLNKTCWNGLYRVNGAGKFNVPYGLPKTDFLIDEPNLLACAEALGHDRVRLFAGDFEATIAGARRGDFVFFDPPYVTRHNNNGFIEYNERIFSWQDQKRLAAVAHKLVKRGVNVMVTNAFHADVIELYPGFRVLPASRSSTIASDNTRRGQVTEAIIFNYPEQP